MMQKPLVGFSETGNLNFDDHKQVFALGSEEVRLSFLIKIGLFKAG